MQVKPEAAFPLVDECCLFTRNDVGIVGFDGAYSVPLADGRVLWYFGDTLIGARGPGRSLWYPDGERIGNREMAGIGGITGIVTNSGLLLESEAAGGGDPLRGAFSVLKDGTGGPRELVPRLAAERDGNIRVWCLQGIDIPSSLHLFYQLVRILPEDCGLPVCFEVLGSGLARCDREFLSCARIPAPTGDPGGVIFGPRDPQFAASIARAGAWLYLYGVRKGNSFSQQCCLSRAPAESLGEITAWTYWDGSGWSPLVAGAATLFEGPPNELSVSYNAYLDRWLAIHSMAMTGRIVARTAPAPEGPWSAATLLAEVLPCPGRDLPYPFLVYAAKEHPELARAGGREIALTFVEFEEYFPHLLRIDIAALR